jgi:O-antigen ligase
MRLEKVYLVLFALLPWSVDLRFGHGGLQVPSEPLILFTGLLVGLEVFRQPDTLRQMLRDNSLMTLTAIWMGWMAVSCFFSTQPLVSWKYMVVSGGEWWVFGVGLALHPEIWKKGIVYFGGSMALLVLFTLGHHALYHFRADQAMLAPMPFFPDHTMYGAVLAMVLPWTVWYLFNHRPLQKGWGWLTALVPGLFLVGIMLAFCRAAAMSVLWMASVFMCWQFRRHIRWLFLAGTIPVMMLLMWREPIAVFFREKVQSDVSTMERLNRYSCAERMLADRPWAGFGPGTFQFAYIPYQRPEEMTRISCQSPLLVREPDNYGRGGGAHSELWQAFSECGWPGGVLLLILGAVFLWKGFRQVALPFSERERLLALVCLLSVSGFFLHGLVNNLMHDSRIAALMWGQMALLGSFRTRLRVPG